MESDINLLLIIMYTLLHRHYKSNKVKRKLWMVEKEIILYSYVKFDLTLDYFCSCCRTGQSYYCNQGCEYTHSGCKAKTAVITGQA